MIPLTPSFLIAVAGSYVGVREEGGNNRGPVVEKFLRGVGMEPGQPWCAAFVHYVGYWSHYDHRGLVSAWPLPRTASCYALGQFAKKKEILEEEPQRGDVFLVHSPPLARFAHTGIIVDVIGRTERPSGSKWYDCLTIEGNTNEEGSREGNAVVRKNRHFYPELGDRFIRWTRLDRRETGDPRAETGEAA